MIASKDMEMYDSGLVTDEYIYDKCDTDLEMYNFYASHLCMDKDEIKEQMTQENISTLYATKPAHRIFSVGGLLFLYVIIFST